MLSYVDNGFDTVVKYLTKEKLDEILASEYQHQLIRRIRHETDRERRSALKVKLPLDMSACRQAESLFKQIADICDFIKRSL